MRRSLTAVGIAALAVCCASSVSAQERRYHGLPLDENHRLLIEQVSGMCRVGVFERSRSAGDFLIDQAEGGPGVSPRANPAPDYILEVRSEVLKSSAPNYLQNPGEYYRITVHTLETPIEYSNKVEVPAENARDQLFYEFQQVAERMSGIDKKAVEAAAPLVAEVFKEEQRLPAEIYTSVLKSRSGAFRITPGTRQRRKIEPPQTFAPRPEFNRPELGATKRKREREALPPGAAKPGDLSAPNIPGQFPRAMEAEQTVTEVVEPKE